MKRLAVISLPGLNRSMLGAGTPNLNRLAERGFVAGLDPIVPGVTCSSQTTLLTGAPPRDHGIVGNGWFFRELNEVWLWRQSEKLVQAEPVWEAARKRNPGFTCLKHFWWYAMASSADVHVTPRPVYYADGRKGPDVYSHPGELAGELQAQFGTFPLFNFWGPTANIESSRWIARTGAWLAERYLPTLALIYLPHLDYHQQRVGPTHPDIRKEVRDIDAVAGDLIVALQRREYQCAVLSEYDIQEVDTPVDINRVLRRAGWLKVIHNDAGELIDFGASEAFAVADHQVAHVYVRDPALRTAVRQTLLSTPGVDTVYDEAGKKDIGLDHPRSGDLVAMAADRHWFTYYYWLDDSRAPDFARTVEIHKKPGYDPCELLLDPALTFPKLKVAAALARKLTGFRYTMNVIPLDGSLIKGSHGRPPKSPDTAPVLISEAGEKRESFKLQEMKSWMLNAIFGPQ